MDNTAEINKVISRAVEHLGALIPDAKTVVVMARYFGQIRSLVNETFQMRFVKLKRSKKLSDEQCARLLCVSRPTIERWKDGTSEPHGKMQEYFISILTALE